MAATVVSGGRFPIEFSCWQNSSYLLAVFSFFLLQIKSYAKLHCLVDSLALLTVTGATLTLSGGGLPEEFTYATLHFHWGATDTTGSEHTLDGTQFPLEVRTNSFRHYAV